MTHFVVFLLFPGRFRLRRLHPQHLPPVDVVDARVRVLIAKDAVADAEVSGELTPEERKIYIYICALLHGRS